jgi:hypothetical protein
MQFVGIKVVGVHDASQKGWDFGRQTLSRLPTLNIVKDVIDWRLDCMINTEDDVNRN